MDFLHNLSKLLNNFLFKCLKYIYYKILSKLFNIFRQAILIFTKCEFSTIYFIPDF